MLKSLDVSWISAAVPCSAGESRRCRSRSLRKPGGWTGRGFSSRRLAASSHRLRVQADGVVPVARKARTKVRRLMCPCGQAVDIEERGGRRCSMDWAWPPSRRGPLRSVNEGQWVLASPSAPIPLKNSGSGARSLSPAGPSWISRYMRSKKVWHPSPDQSDFRVSSFKENVDRQRHAVAVRQRGPGRYRSVAPRPASCCCSL